MSKLGLKIEFYKVLRILVDETLRSKRQPWYIGCVNVLIE